GGRGEAAALVPLPVPEEAEAGPGRGVAVARLPRPVGGRAGPAGARLGEAEGGGAPGGGGGRARGGRARAGGGTRPSVRASRLPSCGSPARAVRVSAGRERDLIRGGGVRTMKPRTPTEQTPPLEDGQRLTQPEFHRRYQAYPEDVKFELIGGVVHMASP